MQINHEVNGRRVTIETFDDWVSPMDARSILAGETYVVPADLREIRVVLDVGANVGATSIFLACSFPEAQIHAFEPAPATLRYLERNTSPFQNIEVHPFGLSDESRDADLYRGLVGPGQASIRRSGGTSDERDRVRLESTADWLAANDPGPIDILKVDTEGCETEILGSLGPRLAEIRLLYLEFHSIDDLRSIQQMLESTHLLATSRQFFETGELLYLRSDLVEEIRPGLTRAVLSLRAGT